MPGASGLQNQKTWMTHVPDTAAHALLEPYQNLQPQLSALLESLICRTWLGCLAFSQGDQSGSLFKAHPVSIYLATSSLSFNASSNCHAALEMNAQKSDLHLNIKQQLSGV
eukprot:4915463-Amphidinium_carterae.1